jgi:hypothetical protein
MSSKLTIKENINVENWYLLMEWNKVIWPRCIDLKSITPNFRLFSYLYYEESEKDDREKFFLQKRNWEIFTFFLNGKEEYLFKLVKPCDDLGPDGNRSLVLVLENDREILINSDWTLFVWKDPKDNTIKKTFNKIYRDKWLNYFFWNWNFEYHVTREEYDSQKWLFKKIFWKIFK